MTYEWYRFTDTSNASLPMYLEFGHDTTIDLALTGLGLIKDSPPLSASPKYNTPPANRKWRTTYQVPFAAHMVWEKFSCGSSEDGFTKGKEYIRLLLNGETFDLGSLCEKGGKATQEYGVCEMSQFLASKPVSEALNDDLSAWGGRGYNATCGGV